MIKFAITTGNCPPSNQHYMKNDPLIPAQLPDAEIKRVLRHIDDDLYLFDDIAGMPVATGPLRTTNIIVGICTGGEVCCCADTEEHCIRANDVMIIREGQVISGYKASPDVKGIGMIMSYNFFHEIVKGVRELSLLFLFSRSHPVFRLRASEVEDVTNYFNTIKKKVEDTSNHFRKDVVRLLISAMVYDISNVIYRMQSVDENKSTRSDAIFTDFILLVEQNYRAERRVGWYARQLCITAKYLSETVKQVSKRTPNDWIDNYVVMEMRVQLKNTTKSVKEIAREMNFPNQSFFGKFFKEHVGMSPAAYRKE